MGNRREFLRNALAATTAAALPGVGTAFAAERSDAALGPGRRDEHGAHAAPFLVLIDETLEEAGGFIAATVRLGLPPRLFAGDPGIAWLRDIEPRLASRAAPLAGLTSAATSFCIAYLARTHGLRLVYRIEHEQVVDAAGPRPAYRHRFVGPQELAGAVAGLAEAGPHWLTGAAGLLAACPVHSHAAAALALPDLAASGRNVRSVSWLLAPAT